MTVLVDEDVLGLQVTIQNIPVVQMLDSEDELGSQELGELFIKKLQLVQVPREVSVLAELRHHVQVDRCLEAKEELEDVWMAVLVAGGEHLHDAALADGVLELLVLDEELLLHGLHRHHDARVAMPHLEHASEAALPDNFEHLEVPEAGLVELALLEEAQVHGMRVGVRALPRLVHCSRERGLLMS